MKFVWSLLASLTLIYMGLCVLMYFKQRDLIYYPQLTRVDPAQTDFSMRREGLVLRGWTVNPGRAKAIVYFGGNGESIQDSRVEFARWFPDHSAYLVAYRGYGASDGQPDEKSLLADALAVFDHVKSQHPGQPISVIGRSLGSGVAAYVASKRPVDRLVLVTPYDSLAEIGQAHYSWLPVRWLSTQRYESVTYLAGYKRPVLVVRADRDEVIPAESTERLIASLPAPPQVITLADAGHNGLNDLPAYGQALSAFLQ